LLQLPEACGGQRGRKGKQRREQWGREIQNNGIWGFWWKERSIDSRRVGWHGLGEGVCDPVEDGLEVLRRLGTATGQPRQQQRQRYIRRMKR
jgi:hypothetical protein